MFRSLLIGFLGFVVVWDAAHAGPKDAAVTRASAQLYRWARDELGKIDLADLVARAREALDAIEGAQAAEAAAPRAPASAPGAEALSTDGVTMEPAGVGDSVFAKDAILVFIAEASARTGVSAAYLEALALRESSFNPVAASDSSSARGLYQFIESTWLQTFALHGEEHGQGELAALVTSSGDGRPMVADAHMRTRILDLRYDPKLATFLAAQLARDNRAALEAALARPVSDAELYIAHFLGEAGAETLLEARETSPRASAADLFPWAARANRRYFYDRLGREKSVAQLYDALLLQAGALEAQEVARLETGAS